MSKEKTKLSFREKNNKLRKLVTCAMLIAIATVLTFAVIYKSPFDGSVTVLSMLPIVLIGYLYGVKWGFGSALVFGVLKVIVSMDSVAKLFMPGDSQQLWWKAILICLRIYRTRCCFPFQKDRQAFCRSWYRRSRCLRMPLYRSCYFRSYFLWFMGKLVLRQARRNRCGNNGKVFRRFPLDSLFRSVQCHLHDSRNNSYHSRRIHHRRCSFHHKAG